MSTSETGLTFTFEGKTVVLQFKLHTPNDHIRTIAQQHYPGMILIAEPNDQVLFELVKHYPVLLVKLVQRKMTSRISKEMIRMVLTDERLINPIRPLSLSYTELVNILFADCQPLRDKWIRYYNNITSTNKGDNITDNR